MLTLLIQIDELNRSDSGYPITLRDFNAETGQFGQVVNTETEIPWPFPSAGEGRGDAMAWIEGVLQDAGRPESALGEVGLYLHDLFMANEVGKEWFKLCEDNDRRGQEVRLRTYFDIRPEELQRLPWELMPYKGGYPAFKSRCHRAMRGRPDHVDDVPVDISVPLPIRVLVLVCDQRDDLRGEDEVDAIYAGLSQQPGIWQVEVLREPNWEKLRDTLRDFPPHIFHVISHAGASPSPAFLVRESGPIASAREYWDLTVRNIEDLLIDKTSMPLLFVLNACHTTSMVPAERFRTLGTRGVVATQAEINSDEAVWFTRFFYKHLAENGSIEDAMWHARVEMRNRRHADYHDWGIPVLTVFGSSGGVIRRDFPELSKIVEVLQFRRYPQAQWLVDRTADHRMIWGNSEGPDKQLRPDKHLVVVSGRRKAGKTQLIHSCMLTWELRGSRVIIIDMEDVPEEILSSDRQVLGARKALMHICGSLVAGFGEVGAGGPAGGRLGDLKDRLGDLGEVAQDENAVCDKACGELLEILATRPGEPPLLMVLDHLEKIFENDLHRLSDKLLWPIACGRLDHVYVIATVSDEALKDSRLGDAAAKGEWLSRVDQIEIDFFKPRQAMPLGREFGARKGWIADPKWQSWLEGNPRMQESAWPPAELLRVADAYEAFGGFR